MAVADTAKHYLEANHVYHTLLEVPPFSSLIQAAELAHVSTGSVVQAAVVRDATGLIMAIFPAARALDLPALSKLLNRALAPATAVQIRAVFGECEVDFIPPLPEAFGLRSVIDESLAGIGDVYFAAGDRKHLFQVDGKGFHKLQQHATIATGFAQSSGVKAVAESDQAGAAAPIDVTALMNPPPAPKLAEQLLRLRAHPEESTAEIVRAIGSAPELARQVVEFANVPLHDVGGVGPVDELRPAVSDALGPDVALNFALGLTLAKGFKIPRGGPLGINVFWRHAIYSAALSYVLVPDMGQAVRPRMGTAVLVGLIHNIGLLILGQHFRSQFTTLNTRWIDNPERALLDLERETLGTTHPEFGAAVAATWGLPAEVVTAIREHHNPGYKGSNAVYANLVLITDRLLRPHQIGDASSDELPDPVLKALQLDEMKTVFVMDRVLDACEPLNALAEELGG